MPYIENVPSRCLLCEKAQSIVSDMYGAPKGDFEDNIAKGQFAHNAILIDALGGEEASYKLISLINGGCGAAIALLGIYRLNGPMKETLLNPFLSALIEKSGCHNVTSLLNISENIEEKNKIDRAITNLYKSGFNK